MSLSDQKLYCPVRQEWVAGLPEEVVRQKFLQYMIRDRGFPLSLIAVEKALTQMPHLASVDHSSFPHRRADIISFAKGIHPEFDLYPLLIVECKAVKISPKMIKQVLGYNHFVQAIYVCIVNQDEVRTGWYDISKQNYIFIPEIPPYCTLICSSQMTEKR
jgi:hypothetical protein